MSTVYLLLATQVPSPPQPSGLNDPNESYPAAPLTFRELLTGTTSGVAELINQNSRRCENLARYGTGAYAVASGCGLSAGSGTTVVLGTGVMMIDGPQVYTSVKSLVLPDNLYNASDVTVRAHVWISRTGDLSYRTDLTVPGTPSAYLGSVRTHSGSIYDIDYSGRMELRGLVYRRTADSNLPADTPPSTAAFLHEGDGAIWLWTGAEYYAALDARTVLTSHAHSTAGALDEITTAGAGISLAVVDTGGGVYKLQITNTDPGSTAEPKVKVEASDPTAGYLSEKLLDSSDVTWQVTGDNDGMTATLGGHHEQLPAVALHIPYGARRILKVDFSAFGHFPTSDYRVVFRGFANTCTGEWVVREVGYNGTYAPDSTPPEPTLGHMLGAKTGTVFYVEVENVRSAHPDDIGWANEEDLSLLFDLYGYNWTAELDPTPTLSVARATTTEITTIDLPPFLVSAARGESLAGCWVDFSAIGFFLDASYDVWCETDRNPTLTLVTILAQDKAPGKFYYALQRSNTVDGYSDSYSTGEVELTFHIRGRGWFAQAAPGDLDHGEPSWVTAAGATATPMRWATSSDTATTNVDLTESDEAILVTASSGFFSTYVHLPAIADVPDGKEYLIRANTAGGAVNGSVIVSSASTSEAIDGVSSEYALSNIYGDTYPCGIRVKSIRGGFSGWWIIGVVR